MINPIRPSRRWLLISVAMALVLLSISVVAANWSSNQLNGLAQRNTQQTGPGSKQPSGPSPSRVLETRTLHNAPQLGGTGDAARKSVQAFIDWAGKSTGREHDDVTKALAAARSNKEVSTAFCEQAFAAQKSDHSRALLTLSLLGELRNEESELCLRRFVNLPLPKAIARTKEDSNPQATALALLQAKAVEGLAYLHNKTGDEEVLRQVQKNPSLIVRAAAINAYLYNHGDSAEARKTLSGYVRKGEEIYLDRIRKEKGENKASFNRKLATYLRAHSEVKPPAPKHGSERQKPRVEYRELKAKPKF